MPIFSVVDMDEKLFGAAHPLIRMIAPVSAEHWEDYARRARLRGGLLGLVGAGGDVFGLVTYRVEESLQRGRYLLLENFVTLELNRAAPGRQALCDAAEVLARKQDCASIEVRMESGGYVDHTTDKAQGWLNLGHRLAAVVFVKFLSATNVVVAPAGVLRVAEA